MVSTLLASVVAAAGHVAETSSRNEKVSALASLLADVDAIEAPTVVGLLTGEIRQGKIGVGWAAIRDLEVMPAAETSLSVADVDRAMDEVAAISGSGSKALRTKRLGELMSAATDAEAVFLASVLTGQLRQGALDGVMATAIAKLSLIHI